ncbi:MAG: PDZ domain-containing protein [Chlorobia bacterium]|nr:PDZ domain-containing protein [Fimbriimonadaceae bacterium]
MKLHRSLLSAALALFAVLALGQTPPVTTPPTTPPPGERVLTKEQREEVLKSLANIMENRAFVPGVDLKKWPEFIDKQKDDLEKAEKEVDLSRIVNRALRDFGISHIRFLTPRQADNRNRTSVVSIGVMARTENNALVVTTVLPKSPAETAGIKQGDIITQVDGKAPENSAVLNGEDGSEVKLKVKSGEAEKELTLKRARVSTARPETLTWIDEETAVLKIWTFSRGYSRDNIETLMKEANGKAKNLIVDLRSNGGGSTASLIHLLSLFVKPDTDIGTFISRNTVTDYEKDHTPSIDPVVIAAAAKNKYKTRKQSIEPFKGKVAVLINRGSASASEIFAMGLRETISAPILGTKSAGAVLASVFGTLPQGFQIQYPVSDYVSIKGVRLEKNPIVPDEEVTGASQDGKDPVVVKAVEKLKAAK